MYIFNYKGFCLFCYKVFKVNKKYWFLLYLYCLLLYVIIIKLNILLVLI